MIKIIINIDEDSMTDYPKNYRQAAAVDMVLNVIKAELSGVEIDDIKYPFNPTFFNATCHVKYNHLKNGKQLFYVCKIEPTNHD